MASLSSRIRGQFRKVLATGSVKSEGLRRGKALQSLHSRRQERGILQADPSIQSSDLMKQIAMTSVVEAACWDYKYILL